MVGGGGGDVGSWSIREMTSSLVILKYTVYRKIQWDMRPLLEVGARSWRAVSYM